ncbi:MAG: metal-dependent transcriptional regulator [Nitrospirae bacterium]|nr:metal-dependent transcriptional regulator [Nitrospirota bacterium]MCL5422665.1 metal-dependent transcriptional regulator [Nitrospirota bacterium]
MDRERLDEALEVLWLLDEDGHYELERFRLSSDDPDVDELLKALLEGDFVKTEEKMVRFTEKGRLLARGLIRRHRLAERLFMDVFEMKDELVEADACRMEHILSEELTDSVCTFLGHPPTCPHGKPIPKGECCKRYKLEVAPVVTRLSDFEVGSKGRIVFIIPSEAARLARLGSVGIAPGSTIKLLQKMPSCVIQIDETTIAVDPDIAKEILVKKIV